MENATRFLTMFGKTVYLWGKGQSMSFRGSEESLSFYSVEFVASTI